MTRHLGDGKRVIPPQRVRGFIRAVRAVRNTRVFQTETRVVADDALVTDISLAIRSCNLLLLEYISSKMLSQQIILVVGK